MSEKAQDLFELGAAAQSLIAQPVRDLSGSEMRTIRRVVALHPEDPDIARWLPMAIAMCIQRPLSTDQSTEALCELRSLAAAHRESEAHAEWLAAGLYFDWRTRTGGVRRDDAFRELSALADANKSVEWVNVWMCNAAALLTVAAEDPQERLNALSATVLLSRRFARSPDIRRIIQMARHIETQWTGTDTIN